VKIGAEGVVKETVFLSGSIVGESHRVDCKVRATKTTVDLNGPPEFSNYDILDSFATVKLPDSDYEVLANGFKIRCKLN